MRHTYLGERKKACAQLTKTFLAIAHSWETADSLSSTSSVLIYPAYPPTDFEAPACRPWLQTSASCQALRNRPPSGSCSSRFALCKTRSVPQVGGSLQVATRRTRPEPRPASR